MLSCPWTTQPHAACQLAHAEGGIKRGKRLGGGGTKRETNCRDGAREEAESEAGTRRSPRKEKKKKRYKRSEGREVMMKRGRGERVDTMEERRRK